MEWFGNLFSPARRHIAGFPAENAGKRNFSNDMLVGAI